MVGRDARGVAVGLALLCKGDLSDRVMFCFSLYDDDGNGMIDMASTHRAPAAGCRPCARVTRRGPQDEMQNIITEMMRAMKCLGMIPQVPGEAVIAKVRT